MFTGLVQAVGTVEAFEGARLRLSAELPDEPLAVGESVAVNGCCLTVVEQGALVFDLSEETLARTALGALREGSLVNLERAMRMGDRLGGHVVQGHVDGVAEVLSVETLAGSWRMLFRVPEGGGRYLIDKGSVTLDGVSLTVVAPRGDQFDCHIIPHTWANTTLRTLQAGSLVNVEYDVLAKHVERLLAP